MNINFDEVHIWKFPLFVPLDLQQSYLEILSEEEFVRANKFRFMEHKFKFIAARFYLKTILGLYLSKKPIEIQFIYNEFGKPKLDLQTELMFNMSHSGEIGLVALNLQNDIGIDIEKIQAEYNSEIAERYFSPSENSLLSDSKNKRHDFFKIWAFKESIIKAIGKGLFINLRNFSVEIYKPCEKISWDNRTWHIYPLEIDTNYQAAVATDQTINKIFYWQFVQNQAHLDKVESLT